MPNRDYWDKTRIPKAERLVLLPMPDALARVAALVRRLRADVCHGHLGPACKAVAHARSAARLGTLHVGYKAHHHARLDGLVCVNRAQHDSLPAGDALASVIYNWAPARDPAAAARPTDLRAELGLAPTVDDWAGWIAMTARLGGSVQQ